MNQYPITREEWQKAKKALEQVEKLLKHAQEQNDMDLINENVKILKELVERLKPI